MEDLRRAGITALAAVILATPFTALACTVDSAKPFTSGPLDAQGMFSQWVVDGNGVGLQACTDSYTNDGNPAPCFYDPVEVGNPLSEALGRGGEAFHFLAENVFTSPGTAPISGVLVLGVETAFLSPQVTAGFQTQFQRFRTRINVDAVGVYTVESPWGKKTYRVTALLPRGNGQNRMEISEPIDISFAPNSEVPGLVSPFLIADQAPLLRPEDRPWYIGDGVTPSTVTGSPCGTNFVRVTAVGLDGITPIPINTANNPEGDPVNVFTSRLFTVSGKRAPTAEVPLSIGAAYFSRSGGIERVTVMAEGSTSATQLAGAEVTINGTTLPLVKEGHRYFGTMTVPGPLVAGQTTLSVTARDPGLPSIPNTKTAVLRDFITIHKAEATCTGTADARICNLDVVASSSDDGSANRDASGAPVAPTLTLQFDNSVLVDGAVSIQAPVLPATVTVVSSRGNVTGGAATRAVTVVNQ
ncbi:MAG: hypothetical protein ACKO0U_11305 [Gammaproteobacteria bacterium]